MEWSRLVLMISLLLLAPLVDAKCSTDSDCPKGFYCTDESTIVANCPDGKSCSGCKKIEDQDGDCLSGCLGACNDAGYVQAYQEECRQHREQCEVQCGLREKKTCLEYNSYEDCVARCSLDADPCAAYVGSCDSICYGYKGFEDSGDDGDYDVVVDDCTLNCGQAYESCIDSCDGGSGSVECQKSCTIEAQGCVQGCSGGSNNAQEFCSKDCSRNFCQQGTLYYDGFCEYGECKYYTFECAHGCAEDGSKCFEIETNTDAPSLEIRLSETEVVLDGEDSVEITATLTYQNGTPVRDAHVYFRINDPKSTGVLGRWEFRDSKKKTGGDGVAKGRLSFPHIDSVSRIYWDEYPYDLEIEVRAYRHDEYQDWRVEGEERLSLYSPVPKIKKIALTPEPAQSYLMHNVQVDIEDFDSQSGFTYKIENYGGSWLKHEKSVDTCGGRLCTIKSDLYFESWEWVSPARGLSADEITLAREMASNMEGFTINLMFSAGQDYAERKVGELPSKMMKNVFYGYHIAKSGYNLAQNTENLAKGGHDLYNSANWKEAGYRSLDMTIEGIKTAVGAVVLSGSEVPVLGQLGSAAQDGVDFVAGTVQAGLKVAAARERIMASEPLEEDQAFYVTVVDEDGNEAEEMYSFKMEYLGFKEEQEGS